MNITSKDRLNLIDALSRTRFYNSLPVKLRDDEIGLDHERWSVIIQKLIDNESSTEHTKS